MKLSYEMREKLYRLYMEFFESGERKRRWNLFNDIPWDKLDSARNNERKALCVETFCAEELYLPDYSSEGLDLTRSIFGAAWFQACWSYEESKHGLAFREYLTRSGMRSQAQFAEFEDRIFAVRWTLPFNSVRKMACYGALQEAATWLAYQQQRMQAEREGDLVLQAIYSLVSRDEAAHAHFYRTVVEAELSEDRAGTIADFAHVLARFKMPGDGLILDYQERLKLSGAGISTRTFLARAVAPLIKLMGTTRAELRAALRLDSEAAIAVAISPVV